MYHPALSAFQARVTKSCQLSLYIVLYLLPTMSISFLSLHKAAEDNGQGASSSS